MLATLILVAAVANVALSLALANSVLPSIGVHLTASRTQLNVVAVCYPLGPGGLGAVVRRGR